MEILKQVRTQRGLSQRALARNAAVSFKGLQLMESKDHDWRISTLRKVASALNLPGNGKAYMQVILGENRNDFETFRELGCKEVPSVGLIVNHTRAELVDKLSSQHFALVKGNAVGRLKQFCTFMDIGIDIIM